MSLYARCNYSLSRLPHEPLVVCFVIDWSLAVSAVIGVVFVVLNHEALALEAFNGVQQFVSISLQPVDLPRLYSVSIIVISVVALLILFRGKRFLAFMATLIGAFGFELRRIFIVMWLLNSQYL